MRIITGSAKGMKLKTLAGEDITRPTAERVKEAVFSMINFDIDGARVLDLFGGSGQLALEALSRGAMLAVLGDSDRGAIDVIRENVKKTGFDDKTRVIMADYKSLIRSFHSKESFDIVFLDPPYASKFIPDALDRLDGAGMLAPGALVVCESDSDEPVSHPGMSQKRFARYGRVYITLLVKDADQE